MRAALAHEIASAPALTGRGRLTGPDGTNGGRIADVAQKLPAYPIASVDNALRLLLLFREQQVLRLSTISQRLHVAPSTAHRLLAMLQYHGFVIQDGANRAYIAGPALLEAREAAASDLRATAYPYLAALMDATGETAHRMVRVGRDSMFVEAVEGDSPGRVASRVGITAPAHCTSGGKALLAALTDAEVRALYKDHPPAPQTSRSVADVETLLAELERVRTRGFATSLAESEPAIAGVAVAVTVEGRAAGALVVSAPRRRLDDTSLFEVVQQLRRIAGALSS
jgi:IclR family acetate operon transcriptional repressor